MIDSLVEGQWYFSAELGQSFMLVTINKTEGLLEILLENEHISELNYADCQHWDFISVEIPQGESDWCDFDEDALELTEYTECGLTIHEHFSDSDEKGPDTPFAR